MNKIIVRMTMVFFNSSRTDNPARGHDIVTKEEMRSFIVGHRHCRLGRLYGRLEQS